MSTSRTTDDLIRLLNISIQNLDVYAKAYAQDKSVPVAPATTFQNIDSSDECATDTDAVANVETHVNDIPKSFKEFGIRFKAIVTTVRAEATKIGVMFTSGTRPRANDIQTMTVLFIKALFCLMECTYSQTNTGKNKVLSGPSVLCKTTFKHVKEITSSILTSGVGFFTSLRDACKEGDDFPVPPAATGIVWSACDKAVHTFPERNSDCVAKSLKEIEELIDDAVDELTAEYQAAKIAARGAFDEGCSPSSNNPSDIDSNESEDDDDIWSQIELDTASCTLGMCKATGRALKTARTIFIPNCEDAGFETIMYLDALSDSAYELSSLVDDLVINMYPPQVETELLSNATSLESTVQKFLTTTQQAVHGKKLDTVDGNGTSACKILSTALSHNLEKITTLNS
eukprot:CFRG6710T1